MKSALITGVTGQDGAYLCKLLLEKGYKVSGIYRRLSTPNFWRLMTLDVLDKVTLIPADLADSSSLSEAIRISEPDEVYHLAAQSFVGASFEQPIYTGDVTGVGVTRLLEAVRLYSSDVRFYQASTSELYGNTPEKFLKETSRFEPASPYAAAKLYAYWIGEIYRQAYGLYVSNGILFNHESPLRGLEFVTRKVTDSAARIAHRVAKTLLLGNIETKRDWGYAPEYVEAMWMMLQEDEPDDYVVATGEAHTVRELLEVAFSHVGLDWQDYVKIDSKLMRPIDVTTLCGDTSKIEKKLGWKPRTRFPDLVKLMVDADMDRWERHLNGEIIAWDAPNNPEINTSVSREAVHRQ
jgi:GDPmannose 4,6-dehydratase